MEMPLDEAYLTWLYSQVGSVKIRNRARSYWKLAKLLYQKEFTWQNIDKDENRAQDGRDLRLAFLRESGIFLTEEEAGWLEMGCSFLELLLALSIKLSFQAEGEPKDWFWILIDNLGLTECTDANPPDEEILDHILDKVINRDYAPNGAGGLFPLKMHDNNNDPDQRNVELWYQAENYLLERY